MLAVAAFGLLGGALLVLQVLESPSVPDRVIPVPDQAEVVGDVALPVDGGSGPTGDESQRTVSLWSSELEPEELFADTVDELEAAGWQLEQGNLGPGHLVSSEDLEGDYDLDLRLRSGRDGDPPGVRSPPWERGEPYVTVSVATVPG